MISAPADLSKRYSAVLREYLTDATEAALLRGYELAREASGRGIGILELASAHEKTVLEALTQPGTPEAAAQTVARAGIFFVNAFSIFEIAYRSFKEVNASLQALNQTLEERVSERTRALELSEQRLDAIIEYAPNAVVISRESGQIARVNRKAEEIFGYSRDELIGQPVELLVPESARAAHVQHRAAYVAAPRAIGMGVGRHLTALRKDGEEFPVEIGLSFVEAVDDNLAIAAIADISERQRTEEALRESRETLRALIQASPVAICALDPDGHVTIWNPAAERIFGWSEEEVLERPLPTIPESKEEEHRALRQLVVDGGASTELEVQRRRKDGSLIDISLSTAPLRDPLGAVTGIVGVMVDITDQQRSAEQLRRLAGQLLEAQEEDRRQVAYDIHDGLGQLIAASSMHLESFIGHRGAPQSPEVEAELRKAHHCLQDAVVEMRRMVSEVGPLLLEDVGLVEASRRLVADFAERVGWEAEFRAEVDGDRLDRPVETALFRIVQEALANAAKYAGASRIAVTFSRDSDSLLLEVKDWGRGFDPAVVERARDRRHFGLLGMRERARLLGGDFRVESTLGEGTQVTVTVPVQRAAPVVNGGDEKKEVEMVEPGKGQGAKRQGISVIIADDHPMVREGLRSMLDAEGIQVIGEASNGSEAVEKVQQLQPDLVLMDVRMPDMDGLAATELIKQNAAETAVIVVTSYESKEYLRRAIDAGAAGYILKGMSRQSLIDAVRLVKEGGSLIDARLLAELLRDVGMDARREEAPEGALEALSPRERQVLGLLVHGLTNKEIAQEMHYSVGTVKNVVQRVIEKLGVSDRTQAAVFAVRAGLSLD